jgi:D-glycero-D-manno-heptose 1,7-bisphosphate phosphatase
VSGRRAAFLDRDGVVNQLVPDPDSGRPESPLRPGEVHLIPRAAEALKRLATAGWLLICVTNQPAAAKGKVSVATLHEVHARVLELLDREGVHFDASRLCLHHPEAVVAELSGPCDCRKPAPGMLLDAGRELGVDFAASWMIGDTDSDVVAGHSAGCQTVLVQHQGSKHKRGGDVVPDRIAGDLYGASDVLAGSDGVD